MIARDFHRLLQEGNIRFDGTCAAALEAIILAACNYLEQIYGDQTDCARQGSVNSLMDAAITRAIQVIVLNRVRNGGTPTRVSREILASTISWAIYGAAREWFHSANRPPAGAIVSSVAALFLGLIPSHTGTPRLSGAKNQKNHGARKS